MTKYIFESPDGGETVYRRKFGEKNRELVKGDPAEKLQEAQRLWRWKQIFKFAETDSELAELIERAEVYYRLKYESTVEVYTLFDCTNTGVLNRQRNINDDNHALRRDQQRNFETILQCIGMRCQPLNINGPYQLINTEGQKYWTFTFDFDQPDIFLKNNNPVGMLIEDCNQVPMIIGLTESEKELFFTPYMLTIGKSANTLFRISAGK